MTESKGAPGDKRTPRGLQAMIIKNIQRPRQRSVRIAPRVKGEEREGVVLSIEAEFYAR